MQIVPGSLDLLCVYFLCLRFSDSFCCRRKNMSTAYLNESTSCFNERMMMSQKMIETLQLERVEKSSVRVDTSSLSGCYNERIRPLLDAIDKMRNLDVMKEGIQLPSIVVVGDQSSGKSSVLESLAGISLPRGQGICTRVPLIMRLQSCTQDKAEIVMEYGGMTKRTPEHQIKEALEIATEEIAGSEKGISDTPITLHVRKPNAPDLTMVDLPGITRVPLPGQPKDIYEQISRIIMHYITPKESIILNVLPADDDFSTCESIRMSQSVDELGERTLAAVTKCDKAPEGLLEKVTINAVNIGLGYVCVRNRIADESMERARKVESELFGWHPQLSKIDKSMVGIPMLAKRLMQIQAASISKSLPVIVKKVDSTLAKRQSDLSVLPQHFSSPSEAVTAFIKLINAMKECLIKILIQGDFEQFPQEPKLHCTARLREMFDSYYGDLSQTSFVGGSQAEEFMVNEMKMLEEAKGVGLPNFLPRPVFLILLAKRVDGVWERTLGLVSQVWDYLEGVILRVIDFQTQCYPQLHAGTKRAALALILRKKAECVDRAKQILEMEKSIDFTLNPVYLETYSSLLRQKERFISALRGLVDQEKRHRLEWETGYGFSSPAYQSPLKKKISIEGIGEVDVSQAMEMSVDRAEEAFDMEMSVMAYWRVVILRLADGIPLHLQFVYRNLVKNEIEGEILKEVAGPKLNMTEKLLEESPVIANKRRSLINSVTLLRDSKAALSTIMDAITDA